MSEQEDDVEPSELCQTHIYAPDKEYQEYASVVTDTAEMKGAPTWRGEKREIMLSEGGDLAPEVELSSDHPFAVTTLSDGDISRTVVYGAGVAVGYYMHYLETHNFPESHIWNQFERLADESGLPLDQYGEFKETLNTRRRRIRLMDLLEFRIDDGSWLSESYLRGDACGLWRSTDLSEAGENFAESVAQSIEWNPKHCYENAQQAAITHKRNHHVSYVEGIALPKQGAQAVPHAWIEYRDEVVELTWPWHKYDGADAVYFGHRFDTGEVEHAFERRNGGSPLALSDDEVKRMRQLRRRDD